MRLLPFGRPPEAARRVRRPDLARARRVRDAGRDNLVMVLSNGCCDSTAPYLYDDYIAEPDAQPVGEVEGVTVLAPAWLAKLYPADDLLTIDVEQGVIEDSFSLETD